MPALCRLAALLALPLSIANVTAQAVDAPPSPLVLGSGEHTYEWVAGWGLLPQQQGLGNTHGGMVADRQGRIYFSTDGDRAVCVFTADGAFVGSWGAEWKGGLHGLCIRREGDHEFLYLAHTMRGEVAKTTLDGEVLWTLGYPQASGLYTNSAEYRPTGIAVGPSGDLFVVDGYGKGFVHHFDAERRWVAAWGGPGTEPGKMQTPHGIWLDTRGDQPRLLIADRENHRVQVFDLDGKLLHVIDGLFRRPCSFYQRGRDLVVADLAGRVTLLDGDDRLIAQLGDNPDESLRAQNGVPPAQWRDGVFLAPHSACWDALGNLYVMDWNQYGRVSKLRRVDAKKE